MPLIRLAAERSEIAPIGRYFPSAVMAILIDTNGRLLFSDFTAGIFMKRNRNGVKKEWRARILLCSFAVKRVIPEKRFMSNYYLAIDLGADSGRLILGALENNRLTLEEIHRFSNTPIKENGSIYWNIDNLWTEIRAGLKRLRPGR